MRIAPLLPTLLQVMHERIRSGAREIRILREIPGAIEEWMRAESLTASNFEVVPERFHTGTRQLRMLFQIISDIEERMWIFSLFPPDPAVMKKRILFAIPACAEQRVRIAAFCRAQLEIMQQWVPS